MENKEKLEPICDLAACVINFNKRAFEKLKGMDVSLESTIASIQMNAYAEGYFQAIKDAENLLGEDVCGDIYLRTYGK